MCPGVLRSRVIQPRVAGSNGVPGRRLDLAQIADQGRRRCRHHRGLPLASVPHLILHERGIELLGCDPAASRWPTSRIRFVRARWRWRRLEDGLPGRDDVAAVAIQEHDPLESVGHKVVDQVPRRSRYVRGAAESVPAKSM